LSLSFVRHFRTSFPKGQSPRDAPQFIAESLCALLENVDFDEALIGHLPTTFGARERSSEVKKKFEAIAGVG
jgi:hypothetical protein